MATAKQIEANRRNAQKSTGPRTEEGKAASRFNATTHGLKARHFALPHEDVDEVQSFLDAIVEAIAPRDAMEAEMACEIARLSWKLRRAERYEHAVLSIKMQAKMSELKGKTQEATAQELDLAAFDDDAEGQRRRRMISGIRNSLSRVRKELRQWQEAHPNPVEEVVTEEDTPENGFVRPEPDRSPLGTAEPERPLSTGSGDRSRAVGGVPHQSSPSPESGRLAPVLQSAGCPC
jgi:hypothetical protein